MKLLQVIKTNWNFQSIFSVCENEESAFLPLTANIKRNTIVKRKVRNTLHTKNKFNKIIAEAKAFLL